MKQKLQKATVAMMAVLASTSQALAQTAPATPASGLDFSGVIGAIDSSSVVAALTSIAPIMIAPFVARWGFNQIMVWFDGDDPCYYHDNRADIDSVISCKNQREVDRVSR